MSEITNNLSASSADADERAHVSWVPLLCLQYTRISYVNAVCMFMCGGRNCVARITGYTYARRSNMYSYVHRERIQNISLVDDRPKAPEKTLAFTLSSSSFCLALDAARLFAGCLFVTHL